MFTHVLVNRLGTYLIGGVSTGNDVDGKPSLLAENYRLVATAHGDGYTSETLPCGLFVLDAHTSLLPIINR